MNQNNFKVNYRIMPLSFYVFANQTIAGEFDWSTSIKSGQFIYVSDKVIPTDDALGAASLNHIRIKSGLLKKQKDGVLAHEIIHNYQFLEFQRFNKWFLKPEQHWVNHNNKAVQFFKKWLYLDAMAIVNFEVYSQLHTETGCYYDNPFESEANFYSFKYACYE